MRNEIEDIKINPREFKVAKCSACSQQLELPSVHFLCHHSYHMHCFESYAESENECPACMAENRKVLEIIRAQEENKNLNEQFDHQLEVAEDGFSVVSEYFGRGIFNRVTLVAEMPKPKRPMPPPIKQANITEEIQIPVRIPPVDFASSKRANAGAEVKRFGKVTKEPAVVSYPQSRNPFESGSNPFESGQNPFEDDDYDESLNPFNN